MGKATGLDPAYADDMNRWDVPTEAEETALVRRARGGDASARDELILRNLRLVARVALSYARRGGPLDELVSVGHLGLIEAARLFDPARGTRFNTYAVRSIQRKITAFLASDGTIVVPPYVHTQETATSRRNRPFAEKVGRGRVESLDVGPCSLVAEAARPSPWELIEKVRPHVEALPERERAIIRARYLDGKIRRYDIAKGLGISGERVRQLENQAIRRLRKSLATEVA